MPNVTVLPMEEAHWPEVEAIYRAGIATGHATFESTPPTWNEFDTSRLAEHRLVAVDSSGRVVGWAAAQGVSDRCVYAGVVEHSVYVAPSAQGQGLGRQLLDELATSTEDAGIWTIQSGIFRENEASLHLHEAAGFRVLGTRERVGRMEYGPLEGQWRDVLFLERRSSVAGT